MNVYIKNSEGQQTVRYLPLLSMLKHVVLKCPREKFLALGSQTMVTLWL